jgi:hypothetical protein
LSFSAAFEPPSEEFGYGSQTLPPCPSHPQIHPVLIQRAPGRASR